MYKIAITPICYCFVIFFKMMSDAHPICMDDSAPTIRDASRKFKLCAQFEWFGCCNSQKVEKIQDKLDEIIARDKNMSETCRNLLEEMLCQQCSAWSGHMYSTEYNFDETKTIKYPGICPKYAGKLYKNCKSYFPIIFDLKETIEFSEFNELMKAGSDRYCYPDVENVEQSVRRQGNHENCFRFCLEEVVNGLYQPISAKFLDDGTRRFLVAELRGVIWMYLSDRSKIATPFLDISDKVRADMTSQVEIGFKDFVFHPDYKTNGYFYVMYVYSGLNLRISRFEISKNDMNRADKKSELVILQGIHLDGTSHNGGSLFFGKDGFLYISIGDGGNMQEPYNRAQSKNKYLGKILRIDVNSEHGRYSIPEDNPFVKDKKAKHEIYAYGLRNPWRCSMDRAEGEERIFCGDVGLNSYEEIDIIQKGGNYGWRIREGFHCSPIKNTGCTSDENNLKKKFIEPIIEHDHSEMAAIIGGYVYRGCKYPELNGLYFYSGFQYVSPIALKEIDDGSWERFGVCFEEKLCTNHGLSSREMFVTLSFAEDTDGELYLLGSAVSNAGQAGGRMHKLIYMGSDGESQSEDSCGESRPTTNVRINNDTTVIKYKESPRLYFRFMKGNAYNGLNGRLGVRKEGGEWGTVCGKHFTKANAAVICQMQSRFYPKGDVYSSNKEFGIGDGPIWVSNKNCDRSKNTFLECVRNEWGEVDDCTHKDDVAIKCRY
uniref:HHIP-like protein 2 isoform X1 n=2 Tax=Styela clava TaxID=7725 RepID=UPI001939536E|nr:HHIP-like protein 2 isoform X1 [Styela clava]